jgi:NADH:ubiquinone oxidoreductase subunit K
VNEKWDELSLSTSLRNIKQQLLAIILKVELVAEVKTILLGMLIALYRNCSDSRGRH